ncbi:Intracellular distribution of mitochondria [Dispira parvispora]|uniref:Intracellular distribution of mitochondria n=1 Tax=Dispira parvispora TaxID=1520584 RepID=A0A9W8AWV0_9FUNG|nr:Intracellular distribution of mitochondria [Dispira parvispora]
MTQTTESEHTKQKEVPEVAEQGSSVEEAPSPEQQALTLSVKIPDGQVLTLLAAPSETVGDIKQNIIESPESCMHSCFHLTLNGEKLNEFADLGSVEGLQDGGELVLAQDLYTDREVRAHVNRLRDLLIGPYKPAVYSLGVDAGASIFHSLPGVTKDTLADPSSDETTNGADAAKRPGKGGKKGKGSSKGGSDQVNGKPNSKSASKKNKKKDAEEVAPAVQHAFNKFDASLLSLSKYFPRSYHRSRQVPQCLTSLSVSGWNPVPQYRRLQGDLLYIVVTTLEGTTFHITGAETGFYVSHSSRSKFDPSPFDTLPGYMNHSLILLLEGLSPKFNTQFKKLQRFITDKPMLEVLPTAVPHVSYPWCVGVHSNNGVALQQHTFDVARSSEPLLQHGVDGSDSLRDWNDELQSHRELPRTTLQERVLRDRLLHKIQADFTEAAVKGAQAVVEGNVVPLNPLDPAETHMYIYNNIFFSKALDGRGTFTALGGDEAAHVATGKDLEGVRILNSIDLEGVCTLGTAIVDYKGERIVAQSIVPGIFRQQEDTAAAYGSVDNGETVRSDPKFHAMAGKVAEFLHIDQNTVQDAQGDRHTLHGSIETKGITGSDGRNYLLDLFRLNPVDIEFQESEGKAAEGRPVYPHSLTLLRPELVDLYWEHKAREATLERAAQAAETKEEAAGKSDKEGESDSTPAATAQTAETEGKSETEKTESEPSRSDFSLAFNPDAFCEIKIPEDEEAKTTQKDQEDKVRAASQYLRDVVIPKVLADLVSFEVTVVDNGSLAKFLHRRGVNIRYLGRLAQLLDEMDDHVKVTKVKRTLHQSLIVRGVKHLFRKLLGTLHVREVPHCVAHVLNCVLGTQTNSQPKPTFPPGKGALKGAQVYQKLNPESLRAMLKEEILLRYRYALPDSALEFDHSQCVALLRDISLTVGLQMAAYDYPFTSESPCQPDAPRRSTTFYARDVVALIPKVKDASGRSLFAEQTFEAGRISLAQGQRQLGLELLLESLALHEQTYGFLHPETGRCYTHIAMMYYHLGEKEAAADFQRKAIVISERTQGLDDHDTIQNYLNLGLYEYALENTQVALHCLKHTLDMWHLLHGKGHLDLATVYNNIGVMLQSLQDFEMSCEFFKQSHQIHEAVLGSEHVVTATSNHTLAKAYALCGDFKTALQVEKQAYHIFQAKLGEDDPKTKESNTWLKDLTASAVFSAKVALSQQLADQRQKVQRLRQQGVTASQIAFPSNTGAESADGQQSTGKPSGVAGSKGHLPLQELMAYIVGGPNDATASKSDNQGGKSKQQAKGLKKSHRRV